jgi:competence protein ComEA
VAERIITYRTENGSFASAEDLLKVKGIGDATLEKIRSRIVVQ